MADGFDANGLREEGDQNGQIVLSITDPALRHASANDIRDETDARQLPYVQNHGTTVRAVIPPGASDHYNFDPNRISSPTSDKVNDKSSEKAFSPTIHNNESLPKELVGVPPEDNPVYVDNLPPTQSGVSEPKQSIEVSRDSTTGLDFKLLSLPESHNADTPTIFDSFYEYKVIDLRSSSSFTDPFRTCNRLRNREDLQVHVVRMHASDVHENFSKLGYTIKVPTFKNKKFEGALLLPTTFRNRKFGGARFLPTTFQNRKFEEAQFHPLDGVCMIAKHKTHCFAVFVGRKRIRIKKFNTRETDTNVIESSAETIIHRAFTVAESAPVKLTQPPEHLKNIDNRVQDEGSRAPGFESRRNSPVEPAVLARDGFYYLDEDFVACFGCDKRWRIPSIIHRDLSESHWHLPSCQYPVLRSEIATGSRPTHTNQPQSVQSDGRISDIASDPPGQQSIYIPPGDVQRETYRLSTFENFPASCPVERRSLAKSGFYYTGFYDRVKCFSCGRAVEQWDARDNPIDLIWHKRECLLAHNRPCGNVPVTDLFNRLNTSSATRQPSQQEGAQRSNMNGGPNTVVRYPADMPERMRRTGGTYQISPGNTVIISPGSRPTPPASAGNLSAPPAPQPIRWRMANVVSADHRRFLSNLYLNRELDRLTSFARWPSSRPNVSPVALAKSGFFYLGDMDRTQCASCGGVLRNWTLEDDVEEEHRTHFSTCRMVQQSEQRNVPIPIHPESAEELARNYPCRYAASPHMRSEIARRETFDHRWSTGRVGATPADIAKAGFFFLGERDRVKCWYCNGGLQNWEYDDIPWVEHAKWFPNCQFLLQNKGQAFVYRHLSMNPHLARPIIAKQEGSPIDPVANAGVMVRAPDIPPSVARVRQPSPPPTIIDPQEEMRKKQEKVNQILETSDVVKNVIAMGFAKETVRRCLEDKVQSASDAEDVYTSVASLLDDVMKKDEELQREAEQERLEAANMTSMQSSHSGGLSLNSEMTSVGPGPGSGRFAVSGFDDDEDENMDLYSSIAETPVAALAAPRDEEMKPSRTPSTNVPADKKSLQEMLTKIEEERMCKICFSNTADMVFIPCSHMCCCMECTRAIRQCPVCRTKIERAIKTYAS